MSQSSIINQKYWSVSSTVLFYPSPFSPLQYWVLHTHGYHPTTAAIDNSNSPTDDGCGNKKGKKGKINFLPSKRHTRRNKDLRRGSLSISSRTKVVKSIIDFRDFSIGGEKEERGRIKDKDYVVVKKKRKKIVGYPVAATVLILFRLFGYIRQLRGPLIRFEWLLHKTDRHVGRQEEFGCTGKQRDKRQTSRAHSARANKQNKIEINNLVNT